MSLPSARPAFTRRNQIDLIVTDGHDALLAAVSERFSSTPSPRCPVYNEAMYRMRSPGESALRSRPNSLEFGNNESKQEIMVQLEASTRQI